METGKGSSGRQDARKGLYEHIYLHDSRFVTPEQQSGQLPGPFLEHGGDHEQPSTG